MAVSETGLAATAVILPIIILLEVADNLHGAYAKSDEQVNSKATLINRSRLAVAALTASLGLATLVVGRFEDRAKGT